MERFILGAVLAGIFGVMAVNYDDAAVLWMGAAGLVSMAIGGLIGRRLSHGFDHSQ